MEKNNKDVLYMFTRLHLPYQARVYFAIFFLETTQLSSCRAGTCNTVTFWQLYGFYIQIENKNVRLIGLDNNSPKAVYSCQMLEIYVHNNVCSIKFGKRKLTTIAEILTVSQTSRPKQFYVWQSFSLNSLGSVSSRLFILHMTISNIK